MTNTDKDGRRGARSAYGRRRAWTTASDGSRARRRLDADRGHPIRERRGDGGRGIPKPDGRRPNLHRPCCADVARVRLPAPAAVHRQRRRQRRQNYVPVLPTVATNEDIDWIGRSQISPAGSQPGGTNLSSTGGPPLIPVVLVGSSIVVLILLLVARGLQALARQRRS